MPLPNKDLSNQRKLPLKRTDKASPISQRTQEANNKNKPSTTSIQDKAEKLDLNVNPKKGVTISSKKPNIDILDVPKIKDNRQVSSRFKISTFRELKQLPSFKDVLANEREQLLIDKLRQACVVFDFTDFSDTKYKEIKKKALLEILEYFSSGTQLNFSDAIYKELICMVGTNIFRTLPPTNNITSDPDVEEDEPLLEPSWPHLEHVYEVFLRFIEHPEFSSTHARHHLDHAFINNLMQLFDSEDIREREYLKTIIHRIYGKIINHRPYIRKQINYFFYKQIYEDERFRGTCELLEILGSIINGFQVPLKDEHKIFLRRVLLPLHKVPNLAAYHQPLCYCVTEFVKKDKSLLKMVVLQGLLKFWPKTASVKEIMFLYELEEVIVELTSSTTSPSVSNNQSSNNEILKVIARPVALQIARCVCSQHFQVSERALYSWQHSGMKEFISTTIEFFLPITFPALYIAKQHWNKNIHGLAYSALKFMMEEDQKLFDECTVKYRQEKTRDLENLQRHKDWWNQASKLAQQNPTIQLLPQPIQQSVRQIQNESSIPINQSESASNQNGSLQHYQPLFTAPLVLDGQTNNSKSSESATNEKTAKAPQKVSSASSVKSKLIKSNQKH